MSTRKFQLGYILSVTTGRLVSPQHMDGLYDILDFMTGDELSTHQLGRAADEMRPRLLAQHPQLADITGADVRPQNYQQWLASLVREFGESLPVRTEHQFHEIKNPVTEAIEMVDPDRVIRVSLDSPTRKGRL